MRSLCLIILLVSCTAIVLSQSPFLSTYLLGQLQCALDKAPCDYYGHQIKRSLPNILNNDCKGCDPRKMSNAQLLVRYIKMRYPDVWVELMNKYGTKNAKDPNVTY